MARFAILSTVDWEGCRALAEGRLTEEEAASRLTGCAWLFRVSARVDDTAEAARDAVREFFSSEEGRGVAERESLRSASWEEAIRWVPDEVWARYGLEPIRYPDVERVLVDCDETLLSEMEAR